MSTADGTENGEAVDPWRHVPAELRERPQWVVWKKVTRKNAKGEPTITKVPFCVGTGEAAASDDPDTWGAFEAAAAAVAKKRSPYAGIGYVFSDDDPYVGVDLDKSIDTATGTLKPWAQPLVTSLDSYTEISPSGEGVKLIVRGTFPGEGRRRGGIGDDGKSAVEMYQDLRFFTITGNPFTGTPATINDRAEAVQAIHLQFFPPEPPRPRRVYTPINQPGDDRTVIEKVTRPQKWAQLWSGDIGGHPSESEAVWAMLHRIRSFTGDDAGRIDAIFRQSTLAAGKWEKRNDKWRDHQLNKLLRTSERWYYDWSKYRDPFTIRRAPRPASPPGINEYFGDKESPEPAGPSLESDASETASPLPADGEDPADVVRQAIDDAKETETADAIYEAAEALAALDLVEFAKAKAELSTLKSDIGLSLNFNDLDKAVSEARRAARRKAQPAPNPDAAPLPRICVAGQQLRELSDQGLRAMVNANEPPTLFVRGNEPVRLRIDDDGRHTIEPASEPFIRGRLERSANFYGVKKDGEEYIIPPPIDVVRDIAALNLNAELARMESGTLPQLDAVVESPVLRADGSILTRPGYDPATRLFYAPSPGLEGIEIPDRPTARQVAQSKALLAEMIGDFPFEDTPSYANAHASIVTPFIRPYLNGKVPLGLFDKPQPGTGGTLLAEAGATVATGREIAMYGAPRDDEEWRKLITSILMTGASVVVIDNVEGVLESDSLARVLTCSEWADRILGQSKETRARATATWLATGNNLTLGRNIARRCYQIRLNAKTARPWARTGFKHADLVGWVMQRRADLVTAVLTLCTAWHAAGRPVAKSPVLGSFENWSRTMGGILGFAGIEGFLGNLEAMHAEADEEGPQWEAFLSAWQKTYASNPVTVSRIEKDLSDTPLLREALPDELSVLVDHEPGNGFRGEIWKVSSRFKLRLGHALRKRAGMQFSGGLSLNRAGEDSHTKSVQWNVLRGMRGIAGDVSPQTCTQHTPPLHNGHHAHTGTHTRGTQGGGTSNGGGAGYPPLIPASPANGHPLTLAESLPPELRETFEERAATLQIDGGMTKEEAERAALAELTAQAAGGRE